MSKSRYRVLTEGQPHFLTCSIVKWLPVLSEEPNINIILDTLRFLQAQNRITLYAFVIMKDHLHMIASSENLSRNIACFKSFVARRIIDRYSEEGRTGMLKHLQKGDQVQEKTVVYRLWQPGCHPVIIQGQQMMTQKINYIHNNPVRKGLVESSDTWHYSSAQNYNGSIGIIDVCQSWL